MYSLADQQIPILALILLPSIVQVMVGQPGRLEQRLMASLPAITPQAATQRELMLPQTRTRLLSILPAIQTIRHGNDAAPAEAGSLRLFGVQSRVDLRHPGSAVAKGTSEHFLVTIALFLLSVARPAEGGLEAVEASFVRHKDTGWSCLL